MDFLINILRAIYIIYKYFVRLISVLQTKYYKLFQITYLTEVNDTLQITQFWSRKT